MLLDMIGIVSSTSRDRRDPGEVRVLAAVGCESRSYAAEALRKNPVARLKTTLRPSPQLSVFDTVFSPELAGTLTHLTICLMHGSDGRLRRDAEEAAVSRMQWVDVFSDMLGALEPLRKLTYLGVVIHSTVHRDASSSWTNTHSEALLNATRESVFDFEGTAALIVRPLTSLRFLSLATSEFLAEYHSRGFEGGWKAYERWLAAKAWRVAERLGADAMEDKKTVLVELHESVAETIIRQEELVLPEADEEALHVHIHDD